MPNFATVYTPEQRRAVAGAMLGDFGEPMTARQAIEAAARGELGLPAFAMPQKSAYTIRDREKLQREDAATPAPVTVEQRAQAVIEHSLRAIERQVKGGKPPDLERLRQTIRAQKELQRGPSRQPVIPPEEKANPNEYLARIANEVKEEEERMRRQGPDAGHTTNANDDERDEMPVRLDGQEVADPALARPTAGVA